MRPFFGVSMDRLADTLPATSLSPILEAPYLFLADPTGASDHEPQLHVDRGGNRVRGFLCISVPRGEFTSEVLAYPSGWDAYAAREKQFQDAERDRLLYVAATRAGTRLVVAQREKVNTRNPWAPLEKYLDDCPSLVFPEGAERKPLSERVIADDAAAAAAAAISSG